MTLVTSPNLRVDFQSGLLTYDNGVLGDVKVPRRVEINALDKGALGDGSTDDTAAFQAAVDELALYGGGRLIVSPSPRGKPYHVDSAVTISGDNVEVVLMPGVHVEKDPNGTAVEPFVFSGTAPSSWDDLTVDPSAGEVSITATTPANFSAGDWVMIRDNQDRYLGGGHYDHWEINKVRSKSGSVLTLEWPLSDDYVTLATVKPSVATFTPVVGSGIVGPGKISNGDASDPTIGNAGVRFKYSVGCYCRDVEFVYCQQDAVRVFDSTTAEVSGNYCHDPSNMYGSGRGVTIARSTHSLIKGNRFVRSRHAVDVSNFCRHVLVEGNVSRGSGESHYKCHPDAKWIWFVGNEADGAYGLNPVAASGAEWGTTWAPGFGIDRGCSHIYVVGNLVQNVKIYGIGALCQDTEHVVVKGNSLHNCNTAGGSITAAIQFFEYGTGSVGTDWQGFVVQDNYIYGCAGRGILMGISNALVKGNQIYETSASGTSAAIYVRPYTSDGTANDVEKVVVEENYIESVVGHGIYVGSTNAQVNFCTVKGNTIRDCSLSGIYAVPAQVDDLTIDGNETRNCNTGLSNSYGGIVVGAQNSSDVASDNLLVCDNRSFGDKLRGIMTAVDGAKIIGNKVYESTSLGIYLPTGATGQTNTNAIVEGNLVVGTANGIYVADSTGGTVTGTVISRNVVVGGTNAIRLRPNSTNPILIANVTIGNTDVQDDGATTPRYVSHYDMSNYRIGVGTTSPDSQMHLTDKLHVGGELELDGAFNHDGSTLGFYGATPASQPAAYTPTNVTTDRSYDANSTTLDEIADVLGTLIADLQSVGLLQ